MNMKKTIIIDGIEVEVKVCPPSRRKATVSIQRRPKVKNGRGALWVARERGLKL